MSARKKKILGAIFIISLSLGVASEMICRWVLGLGDPPLLQEDPTIEYYFKPNQDCRRFGNRVYYNRFSMRSSDLPEHKASPDELRVLVIGDSIVNGGGLTDQDDLATSRLERSLRSTFRRSVHVCNISAGSWGPPNELAYLKRFGLFDGDVLVIVLSSGDYADVPTFQKLVGVDPNFPSESPLWATSEAISRYLPRLLASWKRKSPTIEPAPPQKAIDSCVRALREMISLGQSSGLDVIVCQYSDRSEVLGKQLPGNELFGSIFRQDGFQPIPFGPKFTASLEKGIDPYRSQADGHPNKVGQELMFEAMLPPIVTALSNRLIKPPRESTAPVSSSK